MGAVIYDFTGGSRSKDFILLAIYVFELRIDGADYCIPACDLMEVVAQMLSIVSVLEFPHQSIEVQLLHEYGVCLCRHGEEFCHHE